LSDCCALSVEAMALRGLLGGNWGVGVAGVNVYGTVPILDNLLSSSKLLFAKFLRNSRGVGRIFANVVGHRSENCISRRS
jgi:hypothetical protein